MFNLRIRKYCFVLLFLVLFSISFAGNDSAQNSEGINEHDDLFEMSLEELMNISVVSSSRQEQTVSESSMTITIVTAEEIHLSGHTNIAEMLRFVPGVDIGRSDRNHYTVGIRGLSSAVSNCVLS